MITVCFTYYRSLTLANLCASLYSVRKQDLSGVDELVVVDNNTVDDEADIRRVVDSFSFTIPTRLISTKHGDMTREQAWSTNFTVRQARTPWVFYTRADYLLDFGMLAKFRDVVNSRPDNWDGFIVSHGRHLYQEVESCERTTWRNDGPRLLPGTDYDYTEIDSGVWMARLATFERVNGFDERLATWGHVQTHFQYKLFCAGVEFVRLREVLFFHPQHGGNRDIELAHRQLAEQGGDDLKKMWARYEGVKPY